MSYDELQNLWKSPGNRPTAADLERQRQALVATLRRQHRVFYCWMALAMTLLALPVVGLADHTLRGGQFALGREWGVLLLLALPWIAAVVFIRRQLRHRRAHSGYEQSVSQSVRAMLDANQAAQQRARIMQVLLALSAPVMALCIWQLQAVDKTRPHEAASLATVMTMLIATSWGGIWWKRRRLIPEEKRLASLLTDLA